MSRRTVPGPGSGGVRDVEWAQRCRTTRTCGGRFHREPRLCRQRSTIVCPVQTEGVDLVTNCSDRTRAPRVVVGGRTRVGWRRGNHKTPFPDSGKTGGSEHLSPGGSGPVFSPVSEVGVSLKVSGRGEERSAPGLQTPTPVSAEIWTVQIRSFVTKPVLEFCLNPFTFSFLFPKDESNIPVFRLTSGRDYV